MTAAFELPPASFSASLSSSRPLMMHSQKIADTLPSLDFKSEDLRARMDDFTARFNEFIDRGKERVNKEKELFTRDIAKIQEKTRSTAREIEQTSSTIQSHEHNLQAQSAETAEMATSIASLTSARDANLSTVATLRAQLAEGQRAVKEKRDEQRRYENWLGGMQSEDAREVDVWEGLLGVGVEKAPGEGGKEIEDKLKVVFSGLGAGQGRKAAGREASFVLDVGRNGYGVLDTQPELEKEEVEKCVRRMAEGENLAGFLKGMRELFVNELSP